MADKLDIDEPHEVLAAADLVATASTAATERLSKALTLLVPQGVGLSPLDRDLTATAGWIRTTLAEAVAGNGQIVADTYRHTAEAVQSLAAVDSAGGVAVERAGP
ncbi:hypothetical protein [Nocardia sp. NBC_00511]|uniref:hypothetical protein n=1 Tax=Nocardia sp. NBC_00511 TaxID=2903591 RepID=UPI002F9108A8